MTAPDVFGEPLPADEPPSVGVSRATGSPAHLAGPEGASSSPMVLQQPWLTNTGWDSNPHTLAALGLTPTSNPPAPAEPRPTERMWRPWGQTPPADPGPPTALGQSQTSTPADSGQRLGGGGQPSEVGPGPSSSAATPDPVAGGDGLSSARQGTSFSEPVTPVEHSAGLGDAGVGFEPSHAGPIPTRAHSRYRVDPYPAPGDAGAQGGHAPVGDFSRLDHPGSSAATHPQPVLPDPPLLDPGRAGGFVPPSGPGDPAVSLNTYQYPRTSTDAGTGVLSARDQAILDTYDTARTDSGQRLTSPRDRTTGHRPGPQSQPHNC